MLLAALVVAAASTGEPSGVEIGARTGFGLPFGRTSGTEGAKLSEQLSGIVPVWIDAGYRIVPSFYFGGYFQWAPGVGTKDCLGSTCSSSDIRFGLAAHWHAMPQGVLDPWLGIGLGYEVLAFSAKGGPSSRAQGFELVDLQAGLDCKLASDSPFSLGPFVSFSVSRFSVVSTDRGSGSQDFDIDEQSMHEWLILGVRGAFGL